VCVCVCVCVRERERERDDTVRIQVCKMMFAMFFFPRHSFS
jgi:hypothetical protein